MSASNIDESEDVRRLREAVKNLQEVWARNYGRYHEIMGDNPRLQSLDEAMDKIDAALQNKSEESTTKERV